MKKILILISILIGILFIISACGRLEWARQIPVKEKTCIDSDGGRNYYEKGYVKIQREKFNDYCGNEIGLVGEERNRIFEYFCTELNGEPIQGKDAQFICPDECFFGACLNATCVDTDSGEKYYKKGVAYSKINGFDNDTCQDNKWLQEAVCNVNDWAAHKLYNCPGSCNDGICINNPPIVDAGLDLKASIGGNITLNASASDPDNNPLTYSWDIISAPTTNFNYGGKTTLNLWFIPTQAGFYVFELTVSDGVTTSSDKIIVEVDVDRNNVLLMHFEDISGPVIDSSGYQNHGTNYGALRGVPGKFGKGVEFEDYINEPQSPTARDMVVIPDSPSLGSFNELTIEAWINPDMVVKSGDSLWNDIYNDWDYKDSNFPVEQRAILFAIVDGKIRFRLTNDPNTNGVELIGGNVQPNVWTHVAATYDGDIMRIYQNGEEVGVMVYPYTNIFDSTTPKKVGQTSWGSGIIGNKVRIDELSVHKKNLSANEIREHYLLGFKGADLTNVLLMHFEDTSGPVVDDSLYQNHGTNYGTIRGVPGKVGNALKFELTSDKIPECGSARGCVNILDSPSLSGFTELTIMAWVYSDDAGDFNVIYQDWWSPPDTAIMFTLYINMLRFYLSDGTTNNGYIEPLLYFGSVPGNKWTHVAVTYDGNSVKFYIDGVQVANKTVGFISIIDTTIPKIIGHEFDGLIDELVIYNRALTTAEILEYYQSTV